MNELLIRLAFIATVASLYVLLVGKGTRRLAFATLFAANAVLVLATDGTGFMQVMQGLTALIAAAGFIRETRQVRS